MKVRVALVLALILAVLLLTPRAAAVRFAKELIQLNVDLIVAVASRATRAVTQETKAIPIVMVDVGDPVAFGFVSNLARPEGNVTGLSAAANEVAAKGLQLLKELAPRATRVVVLMPQIAMPTPTGGVPTRELDAAAPGLGLSLETQFVREPSDFGAAFAAIGQKHPDGMLVIPDHFLYSHRARIIEFAAKNRLPTVYGLREYVPDGGLIGLGADRDEMFRRAAVYVDRILKGTKPADLPVEQPRKFELMINLKTAKALGLTIPQSLLLRADHVIQ